MKPTDTTEKGQSQSLAFEFELHHSAEKVWRALTDPALLSEWLLPIAGLELAPGARYGWRMMGSRLFELLERKL